MSLRFVFDLWVFGDWECLGKHLNNINQYICLQAALKDLLDHLLTADCLKQIVKLSLMILFQTLVVSLEMRSILWSLERFDEGIGNHLRL